MTSALTPRGSTWRWRKLRAMVLARDGGVCWLCGRPGADSVDHVVPRVLGGGDTAWNMRAAHQRCNQQRGVEVPIAPAPSRSW